MVAVLALKKEKWARAKEYGPSLKKGEGFTGTIIKDIWTTTRGVVEMGEGGWEG